MSTDTTESRPSSEIVRVYTREARRPGSSETVSIVTLHAYCPCYLRKGAGAVYDTLEQAQHDFGTDALLCKRSTDGPARQEKPGSDAETETTITDELINDLMQRAEAELAAEAAESSQDADEPQPVADAADDEPSDEQDEPGPERMDVAELVGHAAQPGLPLELVRELLCTAAINALAGTKDSEQGRMSVRLENMDNAGASRREAIEGLVAALGGATDTVAVRNDTGSGIYWFQVDVYAPAAVVAALEIILPVLMDRTKILHLIAGKRQRAQLRADGLAVNSREYSRAVTAFNREFIEGFMGAPGRVVADAVQAAGLDVTCAWAAETAAQAASERKAAAKAAKAEPQE